jgi:hypothetical protein
MSLTTRRAVYRLPPNTRPNSLNCSLPVRTMMASKCISKLARLRPLNSLNHGLQVYLQTCKITASMCISKLTRLWPLNSLNYTLQSISPNSNNYNLQVQLQTHTITVSELAPLQPLSPHDHGLQAHLQTCTITSAKCNFVTGSLWECLRVVGPESQGGQIPELTEPTQWPSGAAGSTWECRRHDWECRRQAWEYLGARTTSLGAPATSLGAPRITLEQSGRNNNFFGNTAGAPGNHSYYLSFNDVYNSCIQFVFSSMYLCI